MPVYLIGEGSRQGPPFNRTFFQTTLGDILELSPKKENQRLTLYLIDGMTLEVCEILQLEEQQMSLRAMRPEDEACDTSIHVVPYGAVYRIELKPAGKDEQRVGFHWSPNSGKARKSGRKAGR